ncbi:glycosyltransferase, partial [Candidatus Poribacteria bacterium]|nr:glycosyltransferase [Candidatus Poribacteria bacterium]
VTVLVAARDEERHIEACLRSLLAQDYPGDLYEVVVVNDRSTDGTPRLIAEMVEGNPNLVAVDIDEEPHGITGKQNALRVGIHHCRGELVLNTDADCIAPPTWVSAMVSRFGPDVGLVMGIPLAHSPGADVSLLTRVQSLDLAFLLHTAVGSAGCGNPASCIGNNFAYRRKALDDVGGYDAMPPSLTEDAVLMRALHSQTNWRIAAGNTPGAVVLTEPATSWRGFYRQRSRWILGGRETHSPAVKVLYVILLYNWVLLLTPAGIAFVPELRAACIGALCAKFVADFAVAWQACGQLARRDVLRAYVPFSAYYLMYGALIGMAALFSRKVLWKGQVYRRRR